MTEPTGYVLTPALHGPHMVHLDPDYDSKCGSRTAGTGTLTGDGVDFREIPEWMATKMLNEGDAIACRRCGLSDVAPDEIETPTYDKADRG